MAYVQISHVDLDVIPPETPEKGKTKEDEKEEDEQGGMLSLEKHLEGMKLHGEEEEDLDFSSELEDLVKECVEERMGSGEGGDQQEMIVEGEAGGEGEDEEEVVGESGGVQDTDTKMASSASSLEEVPEQFAHFWRSRSVKNPM
ncbi:hypothetical protein HU200_022778 [Digitaria exilis]|uniref:Uncharacterized protein n=1 Tax=Digitaria exilis TaxID=1010633 RepID=A0A835C7E5_9POAL|nr:hypothetical protein HU200_022778 [Digitaria exilis]